MKNHPKNVPDAWVPWLVVPGTKAVFLCNCEDCKKVRGEWEKFNIEKIAEDMNT